MPKQCVLCGSGRHNADRCNLAPLALIMQDEDLNEDERSADAAEELERLYGPLWDDDGKLLEVL